MLRNNNLFRLIYSYIFYIWCIIFFLIFIYNHKIKYILLSVKHSWLQITYEHNDAPSIHLDVKMSIDDICWASWRNVPFWYIEKPIGSTDSRKQDMPYQRDTFNLYSNDQL